MVETGPGEQIVHRVRRTPVMNTPPQTPPEVSPTIPRIRAKAQEPQPASTSQSDSFHLFSPADAPQLRP